MKRLLNRRSARRGVTHDGPLTLDASKLAGRIVKNSLISIKSRCLLLDPEENRRRVPPGLRPALEPNFPR